MDFALVFSSSNSYGDNSIVQQQLVFSLEPIAWDRFRPDTQATSMKKSYVTFLNFDLDFYIGHKGRAIQ